MMKIPKLPKLKMPKLGTPKFVKWMMFNPVDIAKNLIRTKEIKKESFLMDEYKSGRVLQVGNDKDNKKYFLALEVA